METLKALLGSKKFLASLAGVIIALVSALTSWHIPEDTLLGLLGVIASFVVGQGIADHGKEAAKIAVGAAKDLDTDPS